MSPPQSAQNPPEQSVGHVKVLHGSLVEIFR